MAYQHGVRVLEQPTDVIAPIEGTAGLQVVFGTAPVNLADDPYGVTNVPVLAYSWAEATAKLGYSEERDAKYHYLYTLCGAMYASFKLFAVAPVIFVNVLDPKTHRKALETTDVSVVNLEGIIPATGVLLDTLTIKKGSDEETPLVKDTDYVLAFNEEGGVVVTLLPNGAGAEESTLKVDGYVIDPTMVKATDIVGASSGGTEKGLEVLRQVYPRFGMTPGLIIAPGWSQDPDVAVVLQAKCEEINGYFRCECFVDIDSAAGGARTYDAVKTQKEKQGVASAHAMAPWLSPVVGSLKFRASAVMAALTAYTDAANDDVPNLSPSNKSVPITGTVLDDATYTEEGGWTDEVLLDQVQANTVNGFGVSTFVNMNGWKSWGNNSAAYPSTTDPKDRWFCCRRFFSWWGNSFILTYTQKVDDPANPRLIEAIVDSENIRGNAYVAQGKCAAARIEFNEAENDVTTLLNGQLKFHTHLSPYTPAEDIVDTLEFDPDALMSALNGGE